MESESDEETEALPPLEMYLPPSCYSTSVKIATWCYVSKAVKTINKMLDQNEKNWFLDDPQFWHLFHMQKDPNHKMMGMWSLVLRTARIEKEKEAWFMVNGVPIRYSMREHALISGLDCHNYPEDYESIGDMSFVQKHFKDTKVTLEAVEKKFMSMKKYSRDRLNMAVLYFLSSVMKGSTKRGKQAHAVDQLFQKIVTDLDRCKKFPWGRFTFLDNIRELNQTVKGFNGDLSTGSVNFPTFVIPLELLAFEAIPTLRRKFRDDVTPANVECPRMCKSIFKTGDMKGFSFEEISKTLGEAKEVESILKVRDEEKNLLSDIMIDPGYEVDVADTIVDSWTRRLVDEGRSICFEDLLAKDIKGRQEPPKIFEKKRQRKGKGAEAETTESESSGFVPLSVFVEFKESCEARFKDLVDRMDVMTARMSAVEVLAMDTASKLDNSGESWMGRVPPTTIVLQEPNTEVDPEKAMTPEKQKTPEDDLDEDVEADEDGKKDGEDDVEKTNKRKNEGEKDVEKPKTKERKGYSDLLKGPYERPRTRAVGRNK